MISAESRERSLLSFWLNIQFASILCRVPCSCFEVFALYAQSPSAWCFSHHVVSRRNEFSVKNKMKKVTNTIDICWLSVIMLPVITKTDSLLRRTYLKVYILWIFFALSETKRGCIVFENCKIDIFCRNFCN